ncbi:MAG: hypothetical protein IMY67_07835 [Bacteroidetes bacterium]|nr:hypothetical protein [Bacteroidota bacterium]
MKAREIKKLPNRSDLMECLTSDDVFSRYLGGLPNKSIISPLRDEKVPSFSLFRHEGSNELMYKDFTTGEVGDCFIFVMKLLKYSKLTDAFCRVAEDFMLTQFETKSAEPTKFTFLPKPRLDKFEKKVYVPIRVRRRNWMEKDIKYWKKKYGYTRAQLEYCNVYPISHFFIGDIATIADRIAYVFVEEKDGKQTYKIYQPYNRSGKKWINNNDFSTWELWTQLPARGRVLIITSSRKDAMMIKSFYPSKQITSCALQSEGVRPKIQVMNELKSRFREIYVLYDNDYDKKNNPGRAAGKRLSEGFGITQIEIPQKYKHKDISDVANYHGRSVADALIRRLIKKIPLLDEVKPF